MELFLEICCTIGLSLVLSYILAKVISLYSYGKDSDFDFDLQSCGEKESKKAIGVVENDVCSKDESKSSDFEVSCSDGVCNDDLVDRSIEGIKVGDEKESEFDVNKGGLISDEEDGWEGIERTELERVFGAAVSFVESERNDCDRVLNLGSDVKMELYGLHKVATVGPCLEPQPVVLKMSARAKWNAWKRLGNMDPESAMEQYITLLARNIPDWKQDDVDDDSGLGSQDAVAGKKRAYVAENLLQN